MDDSILAIRHRIIESNNLFDRASQTMVMATGEVVERREIVLAVIPHITGGLSMIGCLVLGLHMISKVKKKEKLRSYHVIIIVMTFVDFAASLAYALGTLPMPQGPAQRFSRPSRYGAYGNQQTCVAQGFTIQFGLLVIMLNVVLSMHFLLAIRWRWREEQLQKFTIMSMIAAILISTALSLTLFFLKGYNYNPLWCWIGPNYVECRGEGLSDNECLAKAVLRRNVFYFVPLLICIGITTLIQACIYYTVRTAERKADRWRMSSKMKSSTFKRIRKHKKQVKRTKIVAVQSLLYLACFYISWVPYFVTVLVLQHQNSLLSSNAFWMLLSVSIFQPLQGFLNCLVYFRSTICDKMKATMSKFGFNFPEPVSLPGLSTEGPSYRVNPSPEMREFTSQDNQDQFEIEPSEVVTTNSQHHDRWEVLSTSSNETLSIPDEDIENISVLYDQ